MEKAKQAILKFNQERDWEQFHTPENLAKSISIEAAELLECFQWSPHYDQQAVKEELADILAYCINLAYKLDINLEQAILEKMEKNAKKYPVELAKGNATKYTHLK